MNNKTNCLIAGVLVLIVFLISGLTYLISLGPCQTGTLSCDDTKTCVPQSLICNNHRDCADGQDENQIQCGNFHGSKKLIEDEMMMAEERRNLSLNQTKPVCILEKIPKKCLCKEKSALFCRGNFTKIPNELSVNTTFLLLMNGDLKFYENESLPVKLAFLNFKNNNISYIPPKLFAGLKNLKRLYLNQNQIKNLPKYIFTNLKNLLYLFLDENQLTELSLKIFDGLNSLKWLDLSKNQLTLDGERFPIMENILEIDLDNNSILMIDEILFANLKNLHLLSLSDNKIIYIHPDAFLKLTELRELRLSGNQLTTNLPDCIFSSLFLLDALYIGFNNIAVTSSLLKNLNISYLNLDGIDFQQIDFVALKKIESLIFIIYKEFRYCSNTPNIKKCRPNTDGVSSLTDLLSNSVLRYSTWMMAVLTFLGNSLVLYGRSARSTKRDENRLVSMVIQNLAVADMLMGIYLCILGIQDYRYREIYFEIAHEWVSSTLCILTGILAMISSEVSILIMAFMSVERFLLIADPFGGHYKLNERNVFVTLFTIWISGCTIAILPVILYKSSTFFYGTYSGTCFPLHLHEKYPIGWQFSTFIFCGLNMTLLILIAILYSALLLSIYRTRKATPTPLSVLDYEFAIRFFFIVLTDSFCWIPIIIFKLLAFMSHSISDDVYAFLIIFIIPLNSAINPLLYTFTVPKYRRFIKGNWYKIKWMRNGSTSNQDDSQGKIIPLLTTGTGQNCRF